MYKSFTSLVAAIDPDYQAVPDGEIVSLDCESSPQFYDPRGAREGNEVAGLFSPWVSER